MTPILRSRAVPSQRRPQIAVHPPLTVSRSQRSLSIAWILGSRVSVSRQPKQCTIHFHSPPWTARPPPHSSRPPEPDRVRSPTLSGPPKPLADGGLRLRQKRRVKIVRHRRTLENTRAAAAVSGRHVVGAVFCPPMVPARVDKPVPLAVWTGNERLSIPQSRKNSREHR